MDNKRKKITAYLHPDLYPQDALTQEYVEHIPSQTRGEFYRQSIICGAVLSTIDTRLLSLISSFYHQNVTAEDLVKIIEQVTGYKSSSVDMSALKDILNNIVIQARNEQIIREKDDNQNTKQTKLSSFKK
ncbi:MULTISPECIES: plasmid partitioning/stability family protein [Klebsiella]|uniref:plasmid partitioning/stability family protein n=1 Tax=Klebsiella TaxID=570 RepID=UPI001A220258|nr:MULTISPECIES: plasmid partitioning/stability family protein [Klebsiella]HAZ3451735.1 plasmid stabilization protein [Raoultella ornithinolytica]HDT4783469.1 plasmid partitioning/stability family protein [Klebsiella pneumoniae subsp. pneumoniae]MDM6952611.1 plasmid partitioning/stability family protein [Klebsiella michiganensis]MDM6966188.1 plasmid partitioning/stability family protein [Klebsiella michiganensis]MDM7007462.1 plasmid partitioning/stability family protein [Klebsiella michiganens